MHPKLHKVSTCAGALASDLGLETTLWEVAELSVTVAASVDLGEPRIIVAELVTFAMLGGELTMAARLQVPAEPLFELADLEAMHRAVVSLTAWGIAARRLARRLP